jgi:hypothetical protein
LSLLIGSFGSLEINDGFFDIGKVFGPTVGADIDAVGAIFSAPPVVKVPEPGSLALLAGGLLLSSLVRLSSKAK